MVSRTSTSGSLHVPASVRSLPREWMWVKLEDACLEIVDCAHSTPKLSPDGPLMVHSQDIRSGIFRSEDAAHVSEETYTERTRRARPIYGDLLYSREGTYFGIAAEVPPNTRVCLGQRMVLIRPDPNRLHFRYLRYWLNSPILTTHVYGQRDGSVAERLNLPTIRNLPIPILPLSEQCAITHILGTLDDKIELNRQMNHTLEAIARTLFKSWFVDFDPVYAKAEGRQPYGIDTETAAVFPDSFEDSRLGKIPKGWKVSKIDDIVEFAYGKALKDEVRLPGSVPVYGSNGRIGWHNEALVKGPGIVVGRKGNPGTVTWVAKDFFPIDTTFYIVPNNLIHNMHFLYCVLSLQDLASLAADSAVPGLNRNIAYMTHILAPSVEIVNGFGEYVETIFSNISMNDEQSSTLASIRDALLPKLLSGEIRVKDAEKFMEAAT